MKFKNFQVPVLSSSTFKALNLGEKKFKYFQVLSRMRGNPAFGMPAHSYCSVNVDLAFWASMNINNNE